MSPDIFGFNSFDFILGSANTNEEEVEYNNDLNAFQSVNYGNNFVENKNMKIGSENTALNNLKFDENDFLSFLDTDCPNNQECENPSEAYAHESTFSYRDSAFTTAIDDLYGLPQPKRKKIVGELTENNYMSVINENFTVHSNTNTNASPPLSPSNSEVEKQLYLAVQDLYKGMIDEVKQKHSAINRKLQTIKKLFGRVIRIDSAFKNSKDSLKFFNDFIKLQKRLLENVTPETEYNPRRDMEFIDYLNKEQLKISSKKSVEELFEEYSKFIAVTKNYLSDNIENLIDIEVLNEFYEVLELYLKAVLKNKNHLIKEINYAVRHFNNNYSIRECKFSVHITDKIRIFSSCMNSNYIYAVYGNYNESAACKIIKIPNMDKSESPKIHEFYFSADKTDCKRFDKLCKRILTDSQGRIYILQMKDRNPTILVLNENFEEFDLIDSIKIKNDASVANFPVIADMCLHENKLYFMDCENRYIYCYDLDLNYESKIKIPGDLIFTKRDSFFSFSENYIFIVDATSFFAFIPDTELYVEAKEKFINQTKMDLHGTGFICLNENLIVLRIRKVIYLHAFEIENTGRDLNFKYVANRKISFNLVFEGKTGVSILKSPLDDKIKIFDFSGSSVKLLEYY